MVGSSRQSFLFSFLLCLNITTTKATIFEVMLYTGFGGLGWPDVLLTGMSDHKVS